MSETSKKFGSLFVFEVKVQSLVEKAGFGISLLGSSASLVMEQKHILLSALSVGVGVGVGLGLSSGQAVSKWVNGNCSAADEVTAEQIEQELMRQVVDMRDSKVTFEEFPYYLR